MMGFQLLKKPAFRYATSGFITAIVGYSLFTVGKPVALEFADSFAVKEFKQYGVVGTYRKHFFSFLDRFHGLSSLEAENDNLKAQIATLEKKTTLAETGAAERELASLNDMLQRKVQAETGSPEAKIPKDIAYEVPPHLMPSELYPLGLAYFRKQEYEKTVAILDHLFKIPEDRKYETADNYLMSAIAWYHLKNFAQSKKDVGQSITRSHENDAVHRQAMLWDAMVEKAEGHTQVAQTKLLHFIGQYPHSEEGAWINGSRKPAQATVRNTAKDTAEETVDETVHEAIQKESKIKEADHEE